MLENFITPIRKKPEGTIKFYNAEKGYGFVINDELEEYFFHITNCTTDDLKSGDKVTYSLKVVKRGVNAFNITKCSQ